MLLGMDTVLPPTRTVRTRLPSGAGWAVAEAGGLTSNVLTSPRLLTESSRRSNWLY